jgi:hypothetical protein
MPLFVKKNKRNAAKNILFKQEVNDGDMAVTGKNIQYVVETKGCSSLYCMGM